jgi:ADP-heptose:LPS heptosyltransferase
MFIQEKTRTENNYRLLKKLLALPTWKDMLSNKAAWDFHPQFYLKQSNLDFANDYYRRNQLESKLVFGIHPGCMAKNKYRRWNREYFVKLMQLLQDKYQCDFIVIAGPDELEEAEYISKITSSLLVSNEKLDNVAAVVAKCNFFINTDSGLGHVASCFNIKTLTIFGPGDERQTAPFSENSYIIKTQIHCSPCVRKKSRNCKTECLINLTPQMVFDKVKEIS